MIEDIVGISIDWEVDWDSLSEEGYDHMYGEAWPKIYFNPIIESFKNVCADTMGKKALSSSLKKIIIKNEGAKINAQD